MRRNIKIINNTEYFDWICTLPVNCGMQSNDNEISESLRTGGEGVISPKLSFVFLAICFFCLAWLADKGIEKQDKANQETLAQVYHEAEYFPPEQP